MDTSNRTSAGLISQNQAPSQALEGKSHNNESINKIGRVVIGAFLTISAFFAPLLLGASLPVATFTAITVGLTCLTVGALTYLFDSKVESPQPKPITGNPFQDNQFPNTPILNAMRQETQRAAQQVEARIQQQEQERARIDAQKEAQAAQALQKSLGDYEEYRTRSLGRFQGKDVTSPMWKKMWEDTNTLLDNSFKSLFNSETISLSTEAKKRVFEPYREKYSHLIQFN